MAGGFKRRAVDLVKAGLRRSGYIMKRYNAANVPEARILRLLELAQVDVVVDVGANTGQFAESLRSAGYNGPIVSFEPQREAHVTLSGAAAADAQWTVAPRVALGAEAGTAEMHIAGNSVSSSLRPMLDRHVSAAPNSAIVRTEEVPVKRLDEVLPELLGGSTKRLHLKIDTQGFEKQVLAGAEGLMDQAVTAQVELSLTPMYEGAPSYREMLNLMHDLGFEPFALLPEFTDPQTGRMLFMDGLFSRPDLAPATR